MKAIRTDTFKRDYHTPSEHLKQRADRALAFFYRTSATPRSVHARWAAKNHFYYLEQFMRHPSAVSRERIPWRGSPSKTSRRKTQ